MNFQQLEFKPETRRYLFFMARFFGKKICKNMYQWRGVIWVTGEVPNPFEPSPADKESNGEND